MADPRAPILDFPTVLPAHTVAWPPCTDIVAAVQGIRSDHAEFQYSAENQAGGLKGRRLHPTAGPLAVARGHKANGCRWHNAGCIEAL